MKHNFTGSLSRLPIKKNAKKVSGLLKLSSFFNCALVLLALQFVSMQAIAQTTITSVSLTNTAGTMNSTSSCVGTGGFWSNGWTGSPTKYWEYTVDATGYSNIEFDSPTSSSGTGPHAGYIYCDTNNSGTYHLVDNYTWTGTGCKTISNITAGGTVDLTAWAADPSHVNGNSNLKIRLYMIGASSGSGTNRVNQYAFTGTSSACNSAPTPGTISAGQLVFCDEANTTFTLIGASSGSDITYQWQSATNPTMTWSDISGEDEITFNLSGETSNLYYRCEVVCTNGPHTSYSDTVQITVNSASTPGSITGLSAFPLLVDDTFSLSSSPAGGTWSSSNPSVATIDASGELITKFGGQTVVSYEIFDFMTGCTASRDTVIDVVWPNTLALYAGYDGSSTDVIAADGDITVSALTDANFGNATKCGSGGQSGKTVSTSFTTYDEANGPRMYYRVSPNSGFALNVFQIHARVRVSGTGPTKARLAYSFDGTTWIEDSVVNLTPGGCGASANEWYWTTGGPTITGVTSDFYVAVFPYDPGSGSGTFQLNSLEVYGVVSSSTPCAGTPSGGTISSVTGSTKICNEGHKVLELTHGGGVDISYQWQESANGTSGWTDIAGATNAFYVTDTLTDTNYYRMEVTCNNGGATATSNVIAIDVIPTPSVAITNKIADLGVGDSYTFTWTGSQVGDTIEWFSNYTSTAAIDSGTGYIAGTIFPAKNVVTTLTVKRDGCYGTDKDTFDVLPEESIIYYLGDNGSTTATTAIQNVGGTALVNNGFGTGTPCSRGGLSGLINAPSGFSTSNSEYVSFKFAANSGDLAAISDIRTTVRSSNSGPSSVRLAYRVRQNGSWLPWVDNGEDLSIEVGDDCGYSKTEVAWTDNSTPYSIQPLIPSVPFLIDSMEVGIFAFDATSASGTFQINSITINGRVAPACMSSDIDSLVDVDNAPRNIATNPLNLGTHMLETSPQYNETYWAFINPNNPAVGYFSSASIMGANTASMTAVSVANVSMVATAYDMSNTCLVYEFAPVSFVASGGLAKSGPTSVTNISDETGVGFYPNPASTTLYVDAKQVVNVAVYSIDGKLLIRQQDAKSINISQLANGMYMIHAFDVNNTLIKTEKFIKQ